MIFVVAILLAVVLARLRGGRLERLGQLSFRFAPLIIVGFVIQILIFTPILGSHLSRPQIALAYDLSMILVWGTLAMNWRMPGAPLMALGVFSNWLVITLNGGFMPASQDALLQAGFVSRAMMTGNQHYNNTILIDANTRLPFLADIMAVPAALPFSNVFSPGDLLLATGTAWLVQRVMVAAQPTTGATKSSP
ncbi:MAG TPA: hypothetical protein DEP84_28285 [Chloroflexi bacterium]|nr:hypothetical protein [Chloroflexota bacterium]